MATISSLPTLRRLGSIAIPSDPLSAPMPKPNSNRPSPAESVPSTSRAKIGARLVCSVHPDRLMMTAAVSTAQMTWLPAAYLSPLVTVRSTGSVGRLLAERSILMPTATTPLARYSDAMAR